MKKNNQIAFFYRKKNLVEAENEVVSLSATQQLTIEDATRWLVLIYLTNRRFSGNKKWEEKINLYLSKLEDKSDFSNLLIRAEVHILYKEYDKANDLLQQALSQTDEDLYLEQKILTYAALSKLYVATNNFKEALRIAKDALNLINEKFVSEETIAEVYQYLVQAYLKSQEYGQLEAYSETLLSLSHTLQDVEKEIVALNNLAVVNSIRNDFKTAMGYFLEALNLAKAIGYRQSIANSLINIGTIYAHLQNHDEALSRYETILSEYQDVLENNTLAIVYNNVGNIHHRNNDAEKAKSFFEKTFVLATNNQYQEMIALSLTQLSRAYRLENNLTEALIFAEQSRQLTLELGDVNGQQINLINLAQLHYDLGDFESAIKLCEDGLAVAQAAEDELNMVKAYQLLADIYSHLKDFEKAYMYQFAYAELKENLSQEQRSLQAIDIEIRYDIREKQQKIEQLQVENNYQAQLLTQSKQISQQNAELSMANEELQQFAYVVSHDLKEPLRMIASYVQLIMRKMPKQQSDDIKVYGDFINEGATRMNLLLDGLLHYATVDKDKNEEETIDIQEIIEYATFNLKLLIRETDTQINVGAMPMLKLIPSRFVQLFQNLISNAIKFRKADTTPIIEITCEKRLKDYLFSVKDNGIGIDSEHKDRVFVIFQRLHTRKQYEGTGIGLSICQKIVQRQGGSIWLNSTLGEGTTFYFTIPIS